MDSRLLKSMVWIGALFFCCLALLIQFRREMLPAPLFLGLMLPGLAAVTGMLACMEKLGKVGLAPAVALLPLLTGFGLAAAGFPDYRMVAAGGAIAATAGVGLIILSTVRSCRALLLPGLSVFLLFLLQSALLLTRITRL